MATDAFRPSLRAKLEDALAQLSDEGWMPSRGEREVRIRVGADGRVKWVEPTAVRVPASELEAA